jgi:hypothetical protein
MKSNNPSPTCSLEYTEGIEKDGWLVGDVTFSTASDDKTEILKARAYV